MAKRIYIRKQGSSTYKDQILRQLQNEGDRLIQQMQNQFARELMKQIEQFTTSPSDTSERGSTNVFSNVMPMLSSAAARYLFRSKATVSSKESGRSAAARQLFRLSHSQAAAEANTALARAQKNS